MSFISDHSLKVKTSQLHEFLVQKHELCIFYLYLYFYCFRTTYLFIVNNFICIQLLNWNEPQSNSENWLHSFDNLIKSTLNTTFTYLHCIKTCVCLHTHTTYSHSFNLTFKMINWTNWIMTWIHVRGCPYLSMNALQKTLYSSSTC